MTLETLAFTNSLKLLAAPLSTLSTLPNLIKRKKTLNLTVGTRSLGAYINDKVHQ